MVAKKQIKSENRMSINILGAIPFLALFSIGLIFSNTITYHQKVFKTMLILLSCFTLTFLYYFIQSEFQLFFTKNKVKSLYFFGAYFLFVFVQYITSFITKAETYDRNYYLANYIFLIIFAIYFLLYISDISQIKFGILGIHILVVVLVLWSAYEFNNYRAYPQTLSLTTFGNIWNKSSESDQKFVQNIYRRSGNSFRLSKRLTGYDKSTIKRILSETGYYKTIKINNLLKQFRPRLSFGNTNYFAGYIIALLPLIFLSGFIFYNKEKIYLIFVFIATSVLGFLIPFVITQTTAAMFGIFISFLYVLVPGTLIISIKNKKTKFFSMISLVAILILFPIIFISIFSLYSEQIALFLPRLADKLSAPMFVIKDRINGWTGGLGLFKEYPVFGGGLGAVYPASFKYIPNYFKLYSSSNSFKHSHNEFVEVLGEGGIFGILFFIALSSYIIYRLGKIVFLEEYKKDHRYIALGIIGGIIAVLLQQIFSLSLRMSVTMSAYFALLGIGMAVVSITDKNTEKINNKILGYFTIGSLVTLFIGFLLFKPLFFSEHNLIKSTIAPYSARGNQKTKDFYFNRSLGSKPDNVYALTDKFYMEYEVVQYFMNNNDNDGKFDTNIQEMISTALNTLDKINKIIPGYQNVWVKYFQIYLAKFDFLNTKGLEADTELNKLLFYLSKSLDMNYLQLNLYMYKVHFEQIAKMDYETTIKNYFDAYLLDYFGRVKRNIKENIIIDFGDSTLLIRNGKKVSVTIGVEYFDIVKMNLRKEFEDNEKKYSYNSVNYIGKVLEETAKTIVKDLEETESK